VTQRIPEIMILHPVGVGATRAMNVLSAKLWLRALVDLLPDISFNAAWIPYAEAMVDRERGIRDALISGERCDGAVAVGGEFSRGMDTEWELFGMLRRTRIDLTRRPMPAILSYETFAATRTTIFQQTVTEAFRGVVARAAA
jgi:hypothetical protein